MLAWKAARDKQRKIDAIKNKKDHGFVVKHVMHSPAKYLVSERTTNGTKKGSKQEQKQTDKPSRRITRSCTNNMRKIQIESKVDKVREICVTDSGIWLLNSFTSFPLRFVDRIE